MITLEKFEAKHFEDLRFESSTEEIAIHMIPERLQMIENAPHNFSCVKDGKAIACMGLSMYWPGRAECWTLLKDKLDQDLIVVTRMVRQVLDACPVRRIEASVLVDYAEGHRWMRLLGFVLEAGYLEAYFPDGRAASLYSKVKGG